MAYKKIKPYNMTLDELKNLWEEEYCRKVIYTHDSIRVKFYPDMFEHVFYESNNRKAKDKSILSYMRLEKMLWIKDVLMDETALMFQGWNKDKKIYENNRRVSIVKDDYVVVIWIKNKYEAKFITAYEADNSKEKIMNSPIWGNKKDAD
ncbi:MAG: hypothetical protein PHD45_10060 [Bacteroidales bacterium]|nr:hypothetical protein [Bacteroidales bacterium]